MGQAGGLGLTFYSSLMGNMESAGRKRGASCHCHAKTKHANTRSLALKSRKKAGGGEARPTDHLQVFSKTHKSDPILTLHSCAMRLAAAFQRDRSVPLSASLMLQVSANFVSHG